MLYTFEGWFCSAKLLDFPFFAIALFCTVQFWKHRVSICVSVTCKSLKQSHMHWQEPQRPLQPSNSRRLGKTTSRTKPRTYVCAY